ncbi:MAG TPA: hypothetical protein VMT62_04885 [Syntrophorhabdaceae bacterium]|nr:hypothetical protein [Syntrophorhabdaceae bacterium]
MTDEYMSYDEKKDFSGKKVKVLGSTYEAGKPNERGDWRAKLETREDKLGYLKSALRYWYSKDWFGSERRKQDA